MIYKGKKFPTGFTIFFIFKQLFSQHRMNRCDCWGPDGRLDTKIDQFDLCHISKSYVLYDIKCHIMTIWPARIESHLLLGVSIRGEGSQITWNRVKRFMNGPFSYLGRLLPYPPELELQLFWGWGMNSIADTLIDRVPIWAWEEKLE